MSFLLVSLFCFLVFLPLIGGNQPSAEKKQMPEQQTSSHLTSSTSQNLPAEAYPGKRGDWHVAGNDGTTEGSYVWTTTIVAAATGKEKKQ